MNGNVKNVIKIWQQALFYKYFARHEGKKRWSFLFYIKANIYKLFLPYSRDQHVAREAFLPVYTAWVCHLQLRMNWKYLLNIIIQLQWMRHIQKKRRRERMKGIKRIVGNGSNMRERDGKGGVWKMNVLHCMTVVCRREAKVKWFIGISVVLAMMVCSEN